GRRTTQSPDRKPAETWLALRLTRAFSKDALLEQYLNSAPYGNLALGAEQAAWTYFARPARELSLAEAALLAGLPQAPTDYDPFTHPDEARKRQGVVLDLMRRPGVLSKSDLDNAWSEQLDVHSLTFHI